MVIGFAWGEACDACIAGGRCAAPDCRLSAAVALREQRAGMGRMGRMGLMGIPLRWQRMGSMVVSLLARLQEAM